jgi:hypothetical protein
MPLEEAILSDCGDSSIISSFFSVTLPTFFTRFQFLCRGTLDSFTISELSMDGCSDTLKHTTPFYFDQKKMKAGWISRFSDLPTGRD